MAYRVVMIESEVSLQLKYNNLLINKGKAIFVDFSSEELSKIICDVIQHFGMDKAVIPVESQVILKLLNDSIGNTCKWQRMPKKSEVEFMIS